MTTETLATLEAPSNVPDDIVVHTDKNGITREYTSENRKARVGELVKVVYAHKYHAVNRTGGVFVVKQEDGDTCDGMIQAHCMVDDNGNAALYHNQYVVLVATDVIHYDGKRYVEVKRSASVGERIIVVNAHGTRGQYDNGSILTVRDVAPFRTDGIKDVYFVGGRRLIEGNEYLVLEAIEPIDDIVIHEGRRYRKVQRKANVGELVKIVQNVCGHRFAVGTIQIVAETTDCNVRAYDASRRRWSMVEREYVVLEPIEPIVPDVAPTPSTSVASVTLTGGPNVAQRLAALEARVSRMDMQLRVAREDIVLIEEGAGDEIAALGKRIYVVDRRLDVALLTKACVGTPMDVKAAYTHTITSPTISIDDSVDVSRFTTFFAKAFADARSTPKTYTREQVIDLAKADVETLTKALRTTQSPYPFSVMNGRGHQVVKFDVNRAKRTVVALVHNAYVGQHIVNARGIAHCAPDDCFNSAIGRAISLRRALGLDVPTYFTSAPKPTKVSVGDVVTWRKNGDESYFITRVRGNGEYDFENVRTGELFEGYTYKNLVDGTYAYVSDDSHDFSGGEAS